MKQRISILGCGWLGKPLAIHLISNEHLIKGSTTSNNKLITLKEKGIEPFLIDISNLGNNITDFLVSDILIIAITSKKLEDFQDLIIKIEKSKIRKVIFISSTTVYDNTSSIVTENTPTNKSILSEIEDLFIKNTILESTIIRCGGLFGYDRKPGNFIKNNTIKNPNGFINFIHRDDCILIIEEIIKHNAWRETFNACADTHPTRRDFYTQELQKIGVSNPNFSKKEFSSYKIISSEKIKNRLNYQFKYSDLMLN